MLRTGIMGSTSRALQVGSHRKRGLLHPLDVVYGIFIISAVAVGVVLLGNFDESYKNQLLSVVGGYVSNRSGQSFVATIVSACSMNVLLVMLLLFCGYSSVSLPLIWCIAAFKGLGYGVSTAMVYSIYGQNAFFYVNLLILPNALISSIIIINSCREATVSCSSQWRGGEKSREQIGEYNFKIFRNMILIVLSGVLEGILFFAFGRLFAL